MAWIHLRMLICNKWFILFVFFLSFFCLKISNTVSTINAVIYIVGFDLCCKNTILFGSDILTFFFEQLEKILNWFKTWTNSKSNEGYEKQKSKCLSEKDIVFTALFNNYLYNHSINGANCIGYFWIKKRHIKKSNTFLL